MKSTLYFFSILIICIGCVFTSCQSNIKNNTAKKEDSVVIPDDALAIENFHVEPPRTAEPPPPPPVIEEVPEEEIVEEIEVSYDMEEPVEEEPEAMVAAPIQK